jgi:hypothetical protein
LQNAEIFTVFFRPAVAWLWRDEMARQGQYGSTQVALEKIKNSAPKPFRAAFQTERHFWDGCTVRQRLPGHSCLPVPRQRAIISRSTACNPAKTLFLGLFHAGMATAKSWNGLLL